MNHKELCDKVNEYLKLCNASLKSDLTKRIMYEQIPSYKENYKELPDIKALEYAVSGAKDVLKYGIAICMDELSNYDGKKSKPDEQYVNSLTSNITEQNIWQMLQVLKVISNIFMDEDHWEFMFGGKAWAKIADTLFNIATNYKGYLSAHRENNFDDKIKFGNSVITNLSFFDQLCHNTASIYGKMLKLEQKDKPHNPEIDSKVELGIEQLEVNRLLDARELKNHSDILKVIKPHLDPQITYKDYFKKDLETGSKTNEDQLTSELLAIKQRKHRVNSFRAFAAGLLHFQVRLNSLERKLSSKEYEPSDANHIELVIKDAPFEIKGILDKLKSLPYSEIINQYIDAFADLLTKSEDQLRQIISTLNYSDDIDGSILNGIKQIIFEAVKMTKDIEHYL